MSKVNLKGLCLLDLIDNYRSLMDHEGRSSFDAGPASKEQRIVFEEIRNAIKDAFPMQNGRGGKTFATDLTKLAIKHRLGIDGLRNYLEASLTEHHKNILPGYARNALIALGQNQNGLEIRKAEWAVAHFEKELAAATLKLDKLRQAKV
jgi:hypothetical protein